jgi:hypothetical protein
LGVLQKRLTCDFDYVLHFHFCDRGDSRFLAMLGMTKLNGSIGGLNPVRDILTTAAAFPPLGKFVSAVSLRNHDFS